MEAAKNSSDGHRPPLQSKEEAAQAVRDYAHALVTLGLLKTARDKAIQELHTRHEDGLHGQDGIRVVSARLSELASRLEAWADENRPEFGEAQSLEFSHGFLRYHLGNRKVEFRYGWDEERTLAKLQNYPVTSQWREYLRLTPEINRQEILKQTKPGGKLPLAKLECVGLKIVRGESFEIEAKPDAVANDCDLRV